MKTQIAAHTPKLADQLSNQFGNGASHQTLYSQPSSRTTAGTPWSVSSRTLTGEPLTLRTAVAADVAELATIGGKGFAAVHQAALPNDQMQGVLATTWSEKQLAEMLDNFEIQILVAEVEQRIIGLTCLNPTYRPSYVRRATAIELCRFYLHTDWIGCGVGSKLMTQALQQAAKTGYGICWLRVWQGNKTAIQFYRRWGFTTISAHYYTAGETVLPVWVMIHTLSSREQGSFAQ